MSRGRQSLFVYTGILAVLVTMSGCSSKVPAPKSFKKFNATDGSFSCLYPADWEVEGGAAKDNSFGWGRFTMGSAQIKVSADLAGSLMGDIAKAGQSTLGEAAESPVASVHNFGRKKMNDDFDDYKEKKAKVITAELGEGRQSDFTAAGSLGAKIRGSRTTLLSNDRLIKIICQCPQSEWKTLKPAFEKVVKSVGR